MTFLDTDFVRDLLQRLLVIARRDGRLTPEAVQQVELEVRADWGGDTPYISHGRADCIAERNEKIMALWNAGRYGIPDLAKMFELSIRQIRRIVR